jgi:hypothetical protein
MPADTAGPRIVRAGNLERIGIDIEVSSVIAQQLLQVH